MRCNAFAWNGTGESSLSVLEQSVTLEEMLAARDIRAARQSALLARFHCTLLCLTLNIPGPVKTPEGVETAFALALERIEHALKDMDAAVLHRESYTEKTGYEAFYAIQTDAEALKKQMVQIEDADNLGRLLDLDVLTAEGDKLSRPTPRTCLLCSRQAQLCARSRTHTVEELCRKVRSILLEISS